MTYIAYNSSKAHNNNGVIAKGDFKEYKTLTNAEKFGSRKGLTTVRELSEFHVMANGDLMLIGYYDSAMAKMENEATIAINEAIVPNSQNGAKITNLRASQTELAAMPDTDTVKVAIEVANFVTNYFGYTRPVILVKDNVSTLRYVDTLQLQFNISVTIVGNVACISELPDTDITDYLLSRFTSKVVKSITLAKYQPTITNLASHTGELSNTCSNCNGVVGSWQSNCLHCGLSTSEFWDNVTAIPLDEIVSNK